MEFAENTHDPSGVRSMIARTKAPSGAMPSCPHARGHVDASSTRSMRSRSSSFAFTQARRKSRCASLGWKASDPPFDAADARARTNSSGESATNKSVP